MQYNEILKAYHNSAAYQTWVANKGKADIEVDHDEQERRSKREVGGNKIRGGQREVQESWSEREVDGP